MQNQEKQIPIWFFIGALLAVYGIIIAGYGLVFWSAPPPAQMPEEIHRLHAPVWWGGLMTVLGLFYVIRFRPGNDASENGESAKSEAASAEAGAERR